MAENKGNHPHTTIATNTHQQKFFLSYDMLEQRDVSLPYEDANPEALNLERTNSSELRQAGSGKQIVGGGGTAGAESQEGV